MYTFSCATFFQFVLAEWLVKCEEERGEEADTPDADTNPKETIQETDVNVLPRCTLLNKYNKCNFGKDAKFQYPKDEHHSLTLHVNWLTKNGQLTIVFGPVVAHSFQDLGCVL